jgi:hypothetical protein
VRKIGDIVAKKTKTKAKPLTPKQAEIKINKILRGVDNSAAQLEKHTKNIQESMPVVRELLSGLTNPPEKPAPKAAPKKPAPKKADNKKTPKAKAKPASKKADGKKSNDVKKPVAGRPALKQAIQEVFNGNGAMAASEIWKAVTAKYGYWSRQSLYNALKDGSLFKKDGDKFLSISQEDEKIDKFVESVEKDQSVAEAV